MANKKGLFAAFGLTCLLTIGVVVGVSGQQNKVERFARADSETYKLNTVDWYKEINAEAKGSGENPFNGIDGLHFDVTDHQNATDWHIKLWNCNDPANPNVLTLTNGATYTVTVDFKVDSLEDGKKFKIKNEGGVTEEFGTGYSSFSYEFTASSNHPKVELQFGHTEGNFHVIIQQIVITNKETSSQESRVFFEAAGDFVDRWKAANASSALCSASDGDVKGLLRKYADLLPWVRSAANSAAADPNWNDEPTTIEEQVSYFAGRLNVTFA